VHHRFHHRTRHIPVAGCFSNVFGSSTLKLLLVVCLILLLRDPPSHRLLRRPTLLLRDVFSPGPRLRRPPLSPTPPSPWMAPSSLLIGSAAPRTAIRTADDFVGELLDPPPVAPPRRGPGRPRSQSRPPAGLPSRRGPGRPRSQNK
jgi:hypothetical protein